MIDTLNAIINVNFVTAMLVTAMAVGSGVIFREVTDSNLLTILVVPALAFGALISIYVMNQAGILFSSQKDSNTVLTSGIGMIIALILVLGAIRLRMALGDMRRPPDPSGRMLDTDPGT